MRRKALILLLALAALAACHTGIAVPPSPTLTPAAMPTASPTPSAYPAVSQTATPTLASLPTATPAQGARSAQDARWAAEREKMVVQTIEQRGITDPAVLQAMRVVPRHLFVPDDLRGSAYEDHPLPIGYGQTISQPYIVALMTELLGLQEGDRVLEIGTGSGYQAAVLAEVPGVEVYTIEIVPQLAAAAQARLQQLGYTDIQCKQEDGYYGWAEYGPFDAIIVTAAPDHVPPPLIEQLAEGGRLIIPVGPPGSFQTLWKFVKGPGDDLQAYNMGDVAFVPFTGAGIEQQETPNQKTVP